MTQILEINPDVLYTAKEAAQFFRCGKTNIYSLWLSGELAVINVGVGKKGKRVRGADLIAFLDSRKEGGPRTRMNYRHLQGFN